MNVKDVWINPNGVIAMRVTLASLLVGGLWVGYLNWFAGPFPSDILRYMPLIRLVSAFVGLVLGLQAALANVHRYLGVISVLLCLPSVPIAATFVLAAMMGD